MRRNECAHFDPNPNAYNYEEEQDNDMIEAQFIVTTSNLIDNDEEWSVTIDDSSKYLKVN